MGKLLKLERKDCQGKKLHILWNGALVRLEDLRELPRSERLELVRTELRKAGDARCVEES